MPCQHIKYGFCNICISNRLYTLAKAMMYRIRAGKEQYSVNVLNKLVK